MSATVSRPRFGECGKRFGVHPTQTHLVAICTLPKGHDGNCSNLLPKPANRILRSRR